MPAKQQDLSFDILSQKLQDVLRLETVSRDTLKTLELYREGKGFNVAGVLMSDANDFCGIDVVRFGDNISIIRDREVYERESILKRRKKVSSSVLVEETGFGKNKILSILKKLCNDGYIKVEGRGRGLKYTS